MTGYSLRRVRWGKSGWPAAIYVSLSVAAATPVTGQSGQIRGRIIEAPSGYTIGGARVSVVGSSLQSTSDASGRYVLSNVPAGTWQIQFQSVDHTTTVVSVEVLQNQPARADAVLENVRAYRIDLPSRSFVPAPGIPAGTIAALQQAAVGGRSRALVQFRRQLRRGEREALERQGVELISYIGGVAWHAVISNPALLTEAVVSIGTGQVPGGIRWVGTLPLADKVDPILRERGYRSSGTMPDGRVKVGIDFFNDVSLSQARGVLQQWRVQIEAARARGPSFFVTIDPALGDSIVAQRDVQFVGSYPPPMNESNATSREKTNTKTLQQQVTGLDGTGVTVGIWDGLNVAQHDDFAAGQVVLGETVGGTTWHATHVAGTIGSGGGDPNNDASNCAALDLNCGHAPGARIISYDKEPFLTLADEVRSAVKDNGINIANHSWAFDIGWTPKSSCINVQNDPDCFTFPFPDGGGWEPANELQGAFGVYKWGAEELDERTRDDGVIVVFASGNERNQPPVDPVAGTDGDITTVGDNPPIGADWAHHGGFLTLQPPASGKNIITVGAIDQTKPGCTRNANPSDTSCRTDFSSWGPTWTGRIKPDVVAPGFNIMSTVVNGGVSTYQPMPGTSQAAPAVSGIAALLIQAYRQAFGDPEATPLPSTIKALLVHGAWDIGRVGPDFEYGWGGVDAEASYLLIRDSLVVESQFSQYDEDPASTSDPVRVFVADVPVNQTRFRVTLAWDDYPGSALAHDLELELESPGGTAHFPWTLTPGDPSDDVNFTPDADAQPSTSCDRSADTPGYTCMGTVDNANNVEQVEVDGSVGNPIENGQWTIRVRHKGVGFSSNDPLQKFSLVSDFPFYMNDNVSVVQVIDRTGSMSLFGYIDPAKTAAANFIKLMRLGDEVGVVAFADDGCDDVAPKATSIVSRQAITSSADQTAAGTTIDLNVTAGGCTSIGAGIELAQGTNFLGGTAFGPPHAMVVLSDGFENTDPRASNIITQGGIPPTTNIYTVALGTTADETLLGDIANQTGGSYYQSPTVLGLLGIYYQIQANVHLGEIADMSEGLDDPPPAPDAPASASPSQDLSGDTGEPYAGEPTWYNPESARSSIASTPVQQAREIEARNVIVDVGASEATFALGWLQAASVLRLSLTDPQGNQVTAGSTVRIDGGPTHAMVRVREPAAGTWNVRILRSDGQPSVADYSFAAFVRGAPKLWSFVDTEVEAGSCASPKIQLYDAKASRPIANATVRASVMSPVMSRRTLFDRIRRVGAKPLEAPDEQSGPAWIMALRSHDADSLFRERPSIFRYAPTELKLLEESSERGVYSNCFGGTTVAGTHNIRLAITGTAADGSPFTRRRLLSTIVRPGAPDSANTQVSLSPFDGQRATVTVIPADRYGNVIGPGLASRISVSLSFGELIGDIRDTPAGAYHQDISVPAGVDGNAIVSIAGTDVNIRLPINPIIR